MKKSKIIVPALGIIALSTAASITGTVAWFTASRSTTITAGNFAVTKTTNNLKVTLTAGAGTSVASGGAGINVLEGYKLTDASVNHLTGMAYNPTVNGDDVTIEETNGFDVNQAAGTALAKNTRASSATETVLSVATWKMSVSIEYGSVSGNMALFLKCAANDDSDENYSKMSLVGTGELSTAKGFRMAFLPFSSEDAADPAAATPKLGAVRRVWADNQTSTNCKHVEGGKTTERPNPENGIAYTSPYLIDSQYATKAPDNGAINQSTAEARVDYLGTFAYQANTTVTLNYTVVCWYEGTDPEINNKTHDDLVYQTVSSQIVLVASKLNTNA